MKKNTQFLWFYTIILFAVALVLITFAGMTQKGYEEEIESHKTATVGMQKSVTELSRVNMELTTENNNLKSELNTVKAENESLKGDKAKLETNQKLMDALSEYDKGNRTKAKKLLEGVDSALLTESGKYVYNKIMK